MNQKIKPSLMALLIPAVLFIAAISVASIMIMKPIEALQNIETKAIGETFNFDAVADEHHLVYIEIDQDADIDSITVDEATTTVVIDVDGVKTNYYFEVTYFGTGDAAYEVFDYPADTIMNELRLVFSYTFSEEGSYSVLGTSDASTEYSVNQLAFEDLFTGILGGILTGAGIGFAGVLSLVIILVMRSKSKRALVLETDDYTNVAKPQTDSDLYE